MFTIQTYKKHYFYSLCPNDFRIKNGDRQEVSSTVHVLYIVPVILTVSDKSIRFCGTSLGVGRKFLRTKCVSISKFKPGTVNKN